MTAASHSPIDPDIQQELNAALKEVRKVLGKIEKSRTGKVDYRAWSEARGSVFGELLEAPRLEARYLQHCRVVPSRYDLLPLMPKGGRVAEIGTQYGQFAGHIARVCQPEELHLYDLSFKGFDAGLVRQEGVPVILHEGDSSANLQQDDLPLDWVYLDGDHSYEGVKKDLLALNERVAPGGTIICNDYTPWSPLEACVYGIPKAIHEFCADHGWGFRYLALHVWGYHDVALQRLDDLGDLV